MGSRLHAAASLSDRDTPLRQPDDLLRASAAPIIVGCAPSEARSAGAMPLNRVNWAVLWIAVTAVTATSARSRASAPHALRSSAAIGRRRGSAR
jgi:hypothetical protein